MQYPIDLTVNSGLFEEIWVTASETELRPVAESMGAKFHPRPPEHSLNTATNKGFTYDFLKHHECDYVIMVNTTSPLLRAETLAAFVEYVRKNDFDAVFSVVPERAESFYKGEPLNFDRAKKVNSQNLEPVEKIVWAVTAWKREPFIQRYESGTEPIFGGTGSIGVFAVPKDESCDLDTPEDWAIAEGILAARKICAAERYLEM